MNMRATLTLLPEGGAVLGVPADFPSYEVEYIGGHLKEWLADSTRILMLPFPVDVIDLRAPRPVETDLNRIEWRPDFDDATGGIVGSVK